MALGRNDTCHCGSGKKYKKCHLDADERARALAPRPQPADEPPPPREHSPEDARWARFWEDC